MGKNNRQHRAAKARRRHQHADHGGAPEREQTPPDPRQRQQQAFEVMSMLARGAAILSPGALPHHVRRTLSGLDPVIVSETEGVLASELMARVSAAWEGGWQPQDLRHAALRQGGRQGQLVGRLIARHAQVTGAHTRAPQGWREQLDLVGGAETGPDQLDGDWRPVTARVGPDLSGTAAWTAWADALGLVKLLAELPVLALLMPPPSQWDRPVRPQAQTGTGDRDRLLTRIRALLAKAEATDHPAEAETFTAKAQELMSRHAIDEALLHAGREEAVELLTRRVHLGSPYASTKVLLLSAVARANRARAIYLEHYAIASVVGTPVAVDQVELLFTSLLIQATRAMAAAGQRGAGAFDRSATFRRSFLTAYADRIGERLTEADRETVASYGAELVPVLKRQVDAVEAEFARQFPRTSTMSTGSLDARGWHAGRKAADQAVFVAGRLDG